MELESSRLQSLLKLQAQIRELVKAEKDSLRACKSRANAPANSRARTTTATARWWTLAEYRDRVEAKFIEMLKEAGY